MITGGEHVVGSARPSLRRSPPDEVSTYRVRVDLDHADPPIWRRLELRSDLRLDVVHQVLQAAYDWDDAHLHRFALGGSPFDLTSELFLCPFDVEEGEDEGTPTADVRLDETLQEPGDRLHYVYDYGDSWELTIELEETRLRHLDEPDAVCTDGRRAAPPEDCGGITDAADLAQVLPDPERFELAEVNGAMAQATAGSRLHPRLAELLLMLRSSEEGARLAGGVATALAREAPSDDELRAALRAHQWFLDRAAAGGLPLSNAGYLKPDDVVAAADLVPSAHDGIGTRNREVHTIPVLRFRKRLQAMRLLRRHKGALVLTRLGAVAQRDLGALVEAIADHLVASCDGPAELDTSLLVLAYAAATPGGRPAYDEIAAHLDDVGWRRSDGSRIQRHDLSPLPARDVLRDISAAPQRDRDRVSPEAAYVARLALRR